MEFPVPAYTSFTIPTGATTGQRITFNENGTGEIRVYDSLGNLVDTIGGTSGFIISYATGFTGDVALGNGAILFGTGPAFTGAGNIQSGLTAGGQVLYGSGTSVTNTDEFTIAINAGLPATTTGNANVPHATFTDGIGSSDADMGLSGSWYRTTKPGIAYTWQTPSYTASWAADTNFNTVTPVLGLRYRHMVQNDVWLYGAFTVTAAGATATVFQLSAGYYNTAVQSPFPVLERTAAGVFQVGLGYISTSGFFHIDIGQGFTRNAGDEFFVNAKIPIGNMS